MIQFILKKYFLFTIILFLALTFFYFRLNGHKADNLRYIENKKIILNIAHRGGLGLSPENTITSFNRAIKEGADILELDIRSTSDSILVLLHDEAVDRTTDGKGRISELTLKEAKRLNAGYRWTENDSLSFPFRALNIKIPTFNEFLANFKDYKLNIEIKQHDNFIAKKLCESIKENQIEDNVVIGSFNDEVLDEFRYHCPDVATSPGRNEIRTFYGFSYVYLDKFYSPKSDIYQLPDFFGSTHVLTEKFVNAIKQKNIPIFVWTVNEPDEMKKFIEMGLDGIITDYPDRLSKVLNDYNSSN
tara:strand:+ start:73 stop:978 length:906 start_codon:yes stop_codon:yes gene_type:complete